MHTDRYMPSKNTGAHFYLSTGEVHYFWYFMQGSIMDPYVRHRLRNSWGFCQRHAVGWLLIESAFYHDYFHGPAVLMSDLIGRAHNCFQFSALPPLLAMRLNSREKCSMCSSGYSYESGGYVTPGNLQRSHDFSYLIKFAKETEPYWALAVCPVCTGKDIDTGILCRPHLVQELFSNNSAIIDNHRKFISYLLDQILFYNRSFRWEYRNTETTECKASLISSAFWLSGWTEFINFYHKWG